MTFLLDTNVLSELRRPRPNRNVSAFLAAQPPSSLFVSIVSFSEIRFGIESTQDLTKRADLQVWLDHELRPRFANATLPLTEDIMLRWRLLLHEGRKRNHTFAQPDLILAAAALEHGLTLVTRDVSDMAQTQVPVLNPWKPLPKP